MFTKDLDVAAGAVRVLVADLDPDAIPLCEVLDAWKKFNAIERDAASAKTLLARRVEDGNTWRIAGYRSAAEQLAALAGSSVNTEKKTLETSKRVRKLPKTADAMRKGKLSPAKAASIAGAATVAPDAEDDLLDGAEKKPLAELREECLKAKAVNADDTYKRLRRDRFVRVYKDAEGAWNLFARGTVDDGARFMTVLEPLIDEQFKLARAEGREEPLEAYAFDALMQLAELAGGGASSGDRAAGETPKPKPTPVKHLALIRVDHEALVRGAIDGEEKCEIAGLGPIPVRIARELLGEAILKLVITKGVDVANVTHLGRSVTVAQQVALWWQSRECTREGCTRTERLENDHRKDWVQTHHTRLDEIDQLCDHDHDLKTHKRWSLVDGKGKRPMVPPDDPRHPKHRAPPPDDG
jgi:Domain of unknown function (DUF222)